MKNLHVIGLCFCLLAGACQHRTDGLFIWKQDNAGLIDPKKELPLDVLGWKVEAIPLETTDSCLIKEVTILEESREFYWIVSDNRIGRFDKQGHFQQFIGRVGQGPEEYLSAWLFRTGTLKWSFDEITLDDNFEPLVKPDGPRMQIFNLFETEEYAFVFYTLSTFEGKSMMPFMALYDKRQAFFYPHVNLISSALPWSSVREGQRLWQTSVPGTLYAVKEAVDLSGKVGFEHIKEDDTPVLLRYVYE